MEDFIEKFAEALEIENEENLSPATIFRNLEEWGSMAILALMAIASEEYDVEFDTDDLAKSKTIGDIYNIILSKQA